MECRAVLDSFYVGNIIDMGEMKSRIISGNYGGNSSKLS